MAVTKMLEILELETTAGCNPKHDSATQSLHPDTTEILAFLSSESEPMYKNMDDIAVLLLANALVIHFADSDHLLYSTHFLVSYSLATAVLRLGFPKDAPICHARETLHLMGESNTHFRTGFSIRCPRRFHYHLPATQLYAYKSQELDQAAPIFVVL